MKSCTLQGPKSSNVGYNKLLLIQYIYIYKKLLAVLYLSWSQAVMILREIYNFHVRAKPTYQKFTHKLPTRPLCLIQE